MAPITALLLAGGVAAGGAAMAYAAKKASKARGELQHEHYLRVGNPERKKKRRARFGPAPSPAPTPGASEIVVEGVPEATRLRGRCFMLPSRPQVAGVPLATRLRQG